MLILVQPETVVRSHKAGFKLHWTWVPSGLSSETATIATALGRGIVDAPELWQKLVVLMKSQDKQRLSEMSNTTEAIVLEATRTLSRNEREDAIPGKSRLRPTVCWKLAVTQARLRPEKVGHRLKKLGLPLARYHKPAMV